MNIGPLTHVPDIAWLIALWKAIHGGDPAPSDRSAAAEILAGAAAYLNGQAVNPVAVGALARRFGTIGVELSIAEVEAPRVEAPRVEALTPSLGMGTHFAQICFGVPPHRQCLVVQLPGRFPGAA